MIHIDFESKAQQFPSRIAIAEGAQEITYHALNAGADKLAGTLRHLGVQQDTIVGVMLPSGINLVRSLLAVFKSGGIYLPVDINFAWKRLLQMFTQTGTQVLITRLDMKEQVEELLQQLDLKIQYLVLLDEAGNITVNQHWGSLSSPLPTAAPQAAVTANDSNYIFYTSGSTGEAKAILGRHESLTHFIRWQIKEFGIDENCRVSQLIQFTFDASLRDIFVPLCSGGTLCIPGEEIKSNISKLIDWINDAGITLMHCVPSLLRLILKELQTAPAARHFSKLQQVIMAGELLYAKDVHTFRAAAGDHVELVNFYGPSETTLIKSFHRIREVAEAPSQPIHVGKPIADTALIILNNNGQLCRIGETGEVYIKTPFMTKGYFKNEALTKTVFVQNPLIKDRTDIIYKTGDLGRYLHDRSVEILGRTDEQVKINGIRVELNEIKQAVLEMNGVSEAQVITWQNNDHQHELVCYYTGTAIPETTLRQHLKGLLNESLIPGYFIQLEKFPLNANGKVDKKQLPRPEAIVVDAASYEAVSNVTEQQLENIWKEILGVEQIGRKVSFFRIGGNSLKVTQLISRIYKTFAVNLRIRDVFDHPSIAQLAVLITNSTAETKPAIVPQPVQEHYPLSDGQRRLWVLDQFNEGKTAYNMANAFRLKGQLDKDALEKAFAALISRHEILRTTFITIAETPRQKVQAAAAFRFTLPVIDLSNTPDPEQELQTRVTNDTAVVFDLENGPLLQVKLYTLSADEQVLVIVMHHIIADGWSVAVFFGELVNLYQSYTQGAREALAPLAIQYKDYVHWQQEQLSGNNLQQHRDYWHTQFAAGVPKLELYPDLPRPAVKTYNGSSVSLQVDAALQQALITLGRQQDASLFMVLLAALHALLYRYAYQEDLVIGTPIAGRDYVELEDQLGFYINTLALRTQFSGTGTFTELLQQVRKTVLDGFEHQVYPFDRLVNELQLERDTNRSPLFDVVLVLQNAGMGQAYTAPEGLSVSSYPFSSSTTKFDLIFNITETAEGLQLLLEYNTDLFREGRVQRMLAHYKNVLEGIVRNSNTALTAMDILSASEKQALLYTFNDTVVPYATNGTLHGLLETQAALTPDNIALRLDGAEMTYAELNSKANQLAAYLIEKGIQSSNNVGLITGRGFNMIIGLYGILKTGAAYVPIDPAYPEDRQLYIMGNSGVSLVLTDQADAVAADAVDITTVLGAAYPDHNPGIVKNSKELAYTIYTSGSTGRPKGVMIAHHAAVNLVAWVNKRFNVNEQDRLLFITSMCFDLSVYDIFGILAVGGTVVIARQEEVTDVEKLRQLMLEERITFWDSVPTTMNYLVNEIAETGLPYQQNDLRVVFMSGDWIPVNLPQRIKQYFPQTQVISLGGATEGTVWSNYYPVEKDMSAQLSVPYGKPIDNNFFYILDEHLNPVPQGVVGELYIGGAGVAEGYANDTEKTAYSFVADPFNTQLGSRMYRTGDLGRMMEDYNMEFMGRKDHQVKIRGFRVELGEIKNVLSQHADIKETVIIAETDAGGNKYLVAYLVAQQSLDLAAVKEHAGRHLPDYMIPGCFVCLDALPLSSNGKIDLKALPAPGEAAFTGVQYQAPRNATEEILVTIWQEVLGKPRIGVKDNFFETGGHSLNATRVISRVAQQLNVKLALRDLFVHPTIEALAALVSNTANNNAQAITAAAARQYYPVSHAQKRLWLLEQAADGLTAFNITRALKISGWLDTAALTKAFNHLLERHEILRTRFAEVQGMPVQQVQEPVATAIPVKDLRTENDRELLLNMLLAEAANHSFDLANEQLIQCTLFRLEDRQHVLLINLHHIITDGWSLEVLTKEWLALYQHYTTGAPHNLAPLTLQYKDYAVWHNQELSGSRAAQLQAYWWKQFNELPPVLALPTKQRPAVKTYNGNDLTFEIDNTLVKALQPIMRQHNSGLFTGLLTAVKVLLYRVTAQEDITIGSVHAGREDAALEQQVGLYANTLALRTLLQGNDSFVQVLEKVHETMLGAYEHQAYPFDRLVSDLQLSRDESRHPLFEVYADLLNIGAVDVQQNQPDALQITELEAGGATSKYDLSFRFYDAGETITTVLEYNTDLFEAHTIAQIRDTFLELLTALVRQPEQPIAAITLADSNNGGTDPTALEEAFDFSF